MLHKRDSVMKAWPNFVTVKIRGFQYVNVFNLMDLNLSSFDRVLTHYLFDSL